MCEAVDYTVARRSRQFIPDEVHLLVFIGSKFDRLQKDAALLASQYWEKNRDDELSKYRLKCKRDKVTD